MRSDGRKRNLLYALGSNSFWRIRAIAMEKNVYPAGEGQADISSLLEPYRRELHLHCYRLMGSLQDAEDMVQETMLRAWRRFDTFKGSASLRTWLYTIATNACLDALKKRPPRTMPVAAYPAADPLHPLAPAIAEPIWLEPVPDSWLVEADNPETRYTRRESVSLAFLTALQLLPPRQRDCRAAREHGLSSEQRPASRPRHARETLSHGRARSGEHGSRRRRADRSEERRV